jgi:hypothetical protein
MHRLTKFCPWKPFVHKVFSTHPIQIPATQEVQVQVVDRLSGIGTMVEDQSVTPGVESPAPRELGRDMDQVSGQAFPRRVQSVR